MSGKKITFAAKRPSAAEESSIQNWVEKREVPVSAATPDIKMKRLTVDVTVSLHRKIKSTCALRNLHMADEIRDLLERHFGGNGAGEGTPS